jgi:Amt family ammonium transporter
VVEEGLFIDGGASLLLDQLVASAATLAYSFVMSFIIAKAIDLAIGMRIDDSAEEEGMDLALHAETAYAQ